MQYLLTHDVGYAVGDRNDFALASGIVFKPDAAFIAKHRLVTLPDRFEFAPDLAVEVASPSNTAADLLYKVETYLQYGTQIVWVIYPDEKLMAASTFVN